MCVCVCVFVPAGTAKISDFGMARFKICNAQQATKNADAGTVAYMAPECFENGNVTAKVVSVKHALQRSKTDNSDVLPITTMQSLACNAYHASTLLRVIRYPCQALDANQLSSASLQLGFDHMCVCLHIYAIQDIYSWLA